MTQAVTTGKGTRRSSETVASELLDAALIEFSIHGYEACSTRAIAQRAGWHQPQINYHFGSKEELWRAAVDHLFAGLDDEVGDLEEFVDEPVEAFRASLVHFVQFSARRPELHRIMGVEATVDGPRLAWIVEHHAARLYARVVQGWIAVRNVGSGADLSPGEVWQLVIGLGARPFANAPEIHRVTGSTPRVDEQLSLLKRLLGI